MARPSDSVTMDLSDHGLALSLQRLIMTHPIETGGINDARGVEATSIEGDGGLIEGHGVKDA